MTSVPPKSSLNARRSNSVGARVLFEDTALLEPWDPVHDQSNAARIASPASRLSPSTAPAREEQKGVEPLDDPLRSSSCGASLPVGSSPPPPAMNVLNDVRDRLHRAIMVGNSYPNVVERVEPPSEATYVPEHAARFQVSGGGAEAKFASNSATALLLTRQFETIARKDLALLEQDEINRLQFVFFQTTRWQISAERGASERALAARIEELARREHARESFLLSSVVELENACRRRTEAAAEEIRSFIDRELHRAFSVINAGQSHSERNWVCQLEERARHTICLDCDRSFSRLFGLQIGESHHLVMQRMLQQKLAPLGSTTDDDSNVGRKMTGHRGTGGTRGAASHESDIEEEQEEEEDVEEHTRANIAPSWRAGPRSGSARAKAAEAAAASAAVQSRAGPPAQLHYDAVGFRSPFVGAFDSDVSLPVFGSGYPVGAESERSSSPRDEFSNSGTSFSAHFAPFWGSLWKSTGTLTSWQRRFFVFTRRGKLKYATTDAGPWTTLFVARQIVRVEVDSASGGTYHPPPSSQYTTYCFFVEYVESAAPSGGAGAERRTGSAASATLESGSGGGDSRNAAMNATGGRQKLKKSRARFSCYSRKELNSWLDVLRHATDVIYGLEESGVLARSPFRPRLPAFQHFDRSPVPRIVVAAGMGKGKPTGGSAPVEATSSPAAPTPRTYRRRQQLEEELRSIERQRQEQQDSPRNRASQEAQTFQHVSVVPPLSKRFGVPPVFSAQL